MRFQIRPFTLLPPACSLLPIINDSSLLPCCPSACCPFPSFLFFAGVFLGLFLARAFALVEIGAHVAALDTVDAALHALAVFTADHIPVFRT